MRVARDRDTCRRDVWERFLGDPDVTIKNPAHPGAIGREDCLKPLALSISEGARRLGVGRQTLSRLVSEKASVSIEMAYRLSYARNVNCSFGQGKVVISLQIYPEVRAVTK